MIIFLRIFFTIVLISMLAATTWASSEVALWKMPQELATHPWMIACLFDAYWGFLTFYCWVFYKESKAASKAIWLILILLLGNIAMSIYMLIKLFTMPSNAKISELLLRQNARQCPF